MIFKPRTDVLPLPQLTLWPELDATPEHFTLYGGTALALHLGHRSSVDFDFFSNQSFDPNALALSVPYLRGAEWVQAAPNTLKCRIERMGPVLVSFFGGLGLGQAAAHERPEERKINVASLIDIAGTKLAVVQRRAESRDYLDIDALLRHGIDLPAALAAGRIIYGCSFNPIITLKALSFFDDIPTLSAEVRKRLSAAVAAVNPAAIPELTPYVKRQNENGLTS